MSPQFTPVTRVGCYLRNSIQQVVSAHVSIETWFKTGTCEFVIGSMEITQEDLVVVVGVEQRPEVAGKLVKPGEPDPLLITSIISSFMIQLRTNTGQLLPEGLDSFKGEERDPLTSTR